MRHLVKTLSQFFQSPIKPQDLQALPSQHCYQLTFKNKHYFIKQTTQSREIACTQLASQAQLCPPLLYPDFLTHADNNVMVMTYVAHQTCQKLDETKVLTSITLLLRRLHSYPVEQLSLAPTTYQRIEYYLQQARLTDYFERQGYLNQARSLQQTLDNLCPQQHWIHNDLHANNLIIDQKQVYLIDWEESGTGDPFIDLAEIALYLTPVQQKKLLQQYHQSAIEQTDWQRLQCAYRLRILLCASWALSFYQDWQECELAIKNSNPSDFTQLMLALLRNEKQLNTRMDYLNYALAALRAFNQAVSIQIA